MHKFPRNSNFFHMSGFSITTWGEGLFIFLTLIFWFFLLSEVDANKVMRLEGGGRFRPCTLRSFFYFSSITILFSRVIEIFDDQFWFEGAGLSFAPILEKIFIFRFFWNCENSFSKNFDARGCVRTRKVFWLSFFLPSLSPLYYLHHPSSGGKIDFLKKISLIIVDN